MTVLSRTDLGLQDGGIWWAASGTTVESTLGWPDRPGPAQPVVPAGDGVQYYFLSDDGSKLVLGRTVGGDTIIELGSFRANASMEPIWRFSEGGAFCRSRFTPRVAGPRHRPASTESGEMALGLFELGGDPRLTPVHTPAEARFSAVVPEVGPPAVPAGARLLRHDPAARLPLQPRYR